MTIYNILFPFLILIALGIAVFILSRRLPEAVEKHELVIKEEKKRWWQVLVGKGENVLRVLRVFLLKLDNKLNQLIKRVKEKKEEMGHSLEQASLRAGESMKDYRDKHWQKSGLKNSEEKEKLEKDTASTESTDVESIERLPETETAVQASEHQGDESRQTGKENNKLTKHKGFSRFAQRITSAFQSAHPARNRSIKEIIPKAITPTELKVEKQQYWKKKEEMLIQSIVREPKNVNLYLQLGRLYSIQRNWEDAHNAFLEVLKLDKTNIKAKEELKRIEKYINS